MSIRVPSAACPNSNLVSAMMMPRSSARAAATRYSSRLARLSSSAKAAPSASRIAPNVTFSSWPSSALVAGEKMGGVSGADSTRPSGRGSPAKVPAARYSFQADPDR